jgi:hypothetical protein
MTLRGKLPSQVHCKPVLLHGLLLLVLVGCEDRWHHQNFNGWVSRIVCWRETLRAVLNLLHGQGLGVEGIHIHAVLEGDLLDVAL